MHIAQPACQSRNGVASIVASNRLAAMYPASSARARWSVGSSSPRARVRAVGRGRCRPLFTGVPAPVAQHRPLPTEFPTWPTPS